MPPETPCNFNQMSVEHEKNKTKKLDFRADIQMSHQTLSIKRQMKVLARAHISLKTEIYLSV